MGLFLTYIFFYIICFAIFTSKNKETKRYYVEFGNYHRYDYDNDQYCATTFISLIWPLVFIFYFIRGFMKIIRRCFTSLHDNFL